MKCPNCDETLLMTDRHGIEIDYCPKCRGVWLDKGELDKIIEKSTSDQSALPPQEQKKVIKDDRDDDRFRNQKNVTDQYGRKKRGGFLSDLFDFD